MEFSYKKLSEQGGIREHDGISLPKNTKGRCSKKQAKTSLHKGSTIEAGSF